MDGCQRDGAAALQGKGSGIREFVGQLCGERRNVRERWTGMAKVRYIVGQGGLSKKTQKVQADSGFKGIQANTSKAEIKCVCLNARSIINKKNELDIMVDEIKPHIIGITESWANNDIT